jgi:hypothetical protein
MISLSKEITVKEISPKIKKNRKHLGRAPLPNCAI